ncbi:MAG: hypothetical protein NTZ51_04635, partial [Proteobacteria bacterium]|nr:hypothetical protein [Pseudomonadota bacterium]
MVQKSSGLHASPPGLRALLTSPFSLSAFFALHSLLMNGYKFGWWENLVIHAYYLPATYTRVDPSLYPRDLFVNTMKQGIINSSYFWEGLACLFRYFPVEPVTFIVYLAGLYCIFLALFYLSRTLFNSTLVSCGTLLLYSFGLRQFNVGSEAIYFNFLHSGIIGYPLSLLAIILFLKKRYAWSFFVCGLLFNVHSMYVTFLLFVFCTFFVVRFRSLTGKTVLTCFVSCLIPALPSLVFLIPQIQASYGGDAWLTGIRWTHWVHDFPSYWEPRQYGKPIIFMLLAAIAITRTRLNEIQRDALLLLPGVALMCILGTVFSDMIPLPFIIKLQLWRCLWIFMIIGTIFISGFLLSCWREDVVSRFSIIAIAIIMTGYSAYKNSMPPDFGRIPAWILPVLGAYLFIYGRYGAHTFITGIARGCMALLLPVVTVAPFVSPLRESFFNIGTDFLLIFYCLILFLITLRFFENKFPEPDKRFKLYFYAF